MESTKAQVAARLGAELPHSTVLDEIPRSPHTPNKNVFLEAMEDVVFGSIAGIAGKFIEYPFDTVKVRLQSQSSLHPQYTGPLDCFRQSFARDGLAGLYRGISAPLVGAALENSSLFLSEQLAQKMMFASGMYRSEEKLPLEALFVTGGAAGAVTSLVLTPVELVKCKMQVPDSAPAINASHGKPPPTILGIIRDVYQHNGMKGFWHGQMGTFIRETGGGAAWFGSKETVSALFRKYNAASVVEGVKLEPLPLWQQAVAGASAGMAYNFLFFPADTIKSRMQTSAIQKGAKQVQQTFMSEGKALWKAKGIRGMYAGCGITVFRSAPSSAFVFIIYDGMKHMFAFA